MQRLSRPTQCSAMNQLDRGSFGPLACALVMLVVLVQAGCREQSPSSSAQASDLATVDRVLNLMARRLQLMHDVARYKWNEGKPIEDVAREKQLLDGVVEKARGMNFESDIVRSFFAAQIEAAKAIQQADFDRWKADGQGRFEDAPDLVRIREQIDRLNDELLDALRDLNPLRQRIQPTDLDRRIAAILGEQFGAKERDLAVGPLCISSAKPKEHSR